MKRFENLDDALCAELDKLDKKYAGDVGEMAVQDVEKADKLYHALKSAETYYAMRDSAEWEDKDASGRSYARRGRDEMGQFTSRSPRYGYSGNYGSGWPDMGYSGRYPDMMPPYFGR